MELDTLANFAKINANRDFSVLTVNKDANANKGIILVVIQLVANAFVNQTGKVQFFT